MHDAFMMWYCGEVWAGSKRGSAPLWSLGCSSIPCASLGMPSAVMSGWGYQVGEVTGALSAWWEEHSLSETLGFAGRLPLFGQKMSSFVQLQLCAAAGTTFIHCQGTSCSLSKWTKQGKRDRVHPRFHSPTAALRRSTAHESSLVLSTIFQSKPNHEIVLFLSDHVTSQKLCEGSTKSPVFSFAKLSQVIQSPECFFCQSEFAVIKLHSCEG